MNFSIFTVFLKKRNFISKIRISKVTDYAALRGRIFKVDRGDNDKDYKRIRFSPDGVSIALNIAFIVAYCFHKHHLHDKVPGYLNRCFADTCASKFSSLFPPYDLLPIYKMVYNFTIISATNCLFMIRNCLALIWCTVAVEQYPLYHPTNFSTKYLVMCKVYTDVGGIK